MAKKSKLEQIDVAQTIRNMVNEYGDLRAKAEREEQFGHQYRADELAYEADNIESSIFDLLRSEGL